MPAVQITKERPSIKKAGFLMELTLQPIRTIVMYVMIQL